tara:strand:- start:694 stop:1065 length:372 start_codon:yes stop_codon:yes gene_type:complete
MRKFLSTAPVLGMIWITITSVMILEGLRAFPVYNELAGGVWDNVWELTIPAMMFIYIAGCIGWAGRKYLIVVRERKNPAMSEIILDVRLAIRCILTSAIWPIEAHFEARSGNLTETNVTVSPR